MSPTTLLATKKMEKISALERGEEEEERGQGDRSGTDVSDDGNEEQWE